MTQLPKRIRALKNAYLEAVPSIAINRALAYTEVFKEFEDKGLAKIVLRAKGFKRACETAPIVIHENELIVGHPCGQARAGSLSPDVAWEWLESELDNISTRPQDPYFITEDNKKIIRETIFPFWKGKSLAEKCEEFFADDKNMWEYGVQACITDLTYHMTSGGGDTSPGFDIILLAKGIKGIQEEALENLEKIKKSNDVEKESKISFYTSCLEVCEGIIAYSTRIAEHAKELAKNEKDLSRKKELEEIAEVNTKVPYHKPQTFQEALQAVWTIQSLFLLEENQCSTSLGRVDQYLFPYYENDIKTKKITEAEAFDLIGSFIIKCSEVIWYTPGATAKYFAGFMPFINMCVGGQKREGGDATNDLTYLIMDAVEKIQIYQPSLACRVHNQSPQKYLEKIVDILKTGLGMPAIHFDDAHIKMMLSKGFDYKDARDYSLMGCVEPQKSGKIHQWTAGGFTQWPICIELALNNGVLKTYGEKVWLETGELSEFDTYEKFEAAVKKQLDYLIDINCRGTVKVQEAYAKHNPSPYMSLFVDGCMENGKDVTNGGACLYCGPGSIFAGLATYADSMAAVKKLVYEEQKYSLTELKQALDNNFENAPQILKDCKNAPKYGNDLDYVDYIARDIIDYTEEKMNSYKSLFGSKQIHGTLSQSFNTPLGEMIGASPDGRLAYAPLSDGMSPTQGLPNKGATAIIKSVSKLNVESMSLGMSHNMKVTPNFLDTNEGKSATVSILKTSSMLGNAQLQYNCVDNTTLLKAQAEPEKYRELIVRVAGYSAFFVELCKEVQDEIISRATLTS